MESADRDQFTGSDATAEPAGQDALAGEEFDAQLGEAQQDADRTVEEGQYDASYTDETMPAEEIQPESQGESPLEAELGEEGQGDLAPEDL